MPIFTNPIQSQNQSSQAGNYNFPQLPQIKINTTIQDQFKRESLQPSNSYTLYTTAVDAGGAAAVVNNAQFQLITDVNIGNKSQARTSGMSLSRVAYFVDLRSQITLDVIWNQGGGASTAYSGFIGLYAGIATLSALPTTTRHMGIFWDPPTDANYQLTSANGTTQVKTDTGVVPSNNLHRLNIVWNGADSATINFFAGTTNSAVSPTLSKTVTVTSLNAGLSEPTNFLTLYFWVQTNTTAARQIDVYEWQIQIQ